jgi:hypothetical protein
VERADVKKGMRIVEIRDAIKVVREIVASF